MRAVLTALPVVTHFTAAPAYRGRRQRELCTTRLKPTARFMGVVMNRIFTGGAVSAVAIFAALSCSDATAPNGISSDDLSADQYRVLAAIQVHLASDTIKAGQTTQASVTEQDRRGRPISKPVVWSSSDPGIATVDTTGLVRGVKAGNVSIVATNNSIG